MRFTPVVDFAVGLGGIDPDRIALLGMSMGGYLAPRAAAFEHRIAACIAYDGAVDISSAMPKTPTFDHDSTHRAAELDTMIAHRADAPTSQRWVLSNALWVFDVTTGQELLDEVVKYDLADVADRIRCPTLVCEAENDQFFKGQPALAGRYPPAVTTRRIHQEKPCRRR